MIFEYKRKAKTNSYGGLRLLSAVEAIVIHYTGGTTDTAKNNADYFATGNTRFAGAHIFIDREGNASLSIPLRRIAWSVGDSCNGQGIYYNSFNNANTVSIELCGIAYKDISQAQLKKLKKIIKYLYKKCPNIRNIVRHYDITTKNCPSRYCGCVKNDAKWQLLKGELMPIIGLGV